MLMFAALSGHALQGAAIMVAFGLGTMPAMLTSSAFAARLGQWVRQRGTRQLGGVMLLLFGCWIAWSAIPSPHHDHHTAHVMQVP
jgi:sulfite exporter TauE/SafE